MKKHIKESIKIYLGIIVIFSLLFVFLVYIFNLNNYIGENDESEFIVTKEVCKDELVNIIYNESKYLCRSISFYDRDNRLQYEECYANSSSKDDYPCDNFKCEYESEEAKRCGAQHCPNVYVVIEYNKSFTQVTEEPITEFRCHDEEVDEIIKFVYSCADYQISNFQVCSTKCFEDSNVSFDESVSKITSCDNYCFENNCDKEGKRRAVSDLTFGWIYDNCDSGIDKDYWQCGNYKVKRKE